ncbi:hypothetical protein HYX14_03770 [Candidatus Woesearchaeota archaeon]|nr:hypothetical protein [Candidatus Woesearchaeota archaeon]
MADENKTNKNIGKTILTEIGYAEEFQEFILLNNDVLINDDLKSQIMNEEKGELLQVVKEIGSTPIVIKSVDKYDEEFLLKNF